MPLSFVQAEKIESSRCGKPPEGLFCHGGTVPYDPIPPMSFCNASDMVCSSLDQTVHAHNLSGYHTFKKLKIFTPILFLSHNLQSIHVIKLLQYEHCVESLAKTENLIFAGYVALSVQFWHFETYVDICLKE